MYKAIALDAFGTVCDIHDRRNPYHQLAQLCSDNKDAQAVLRRAALTIPATFDDMLQVMGQMHPPLATHTEHLKTDLQAEIDSIRLYPEVLSVLTELNMRGYKLAIISNLAQPFGAPIEALLRDYIDTFVFSYNIGAMKPEAEIFEALCNSLEERPADILVVGNSLKNDFHGARNARMSSLYLDRNLRSHDGTTIADLTGILSHI